MFKKFVLLSAIFLFVSSCSKKILGDQYNFDIPKNIVIDKGNGVIGPCEPSICISPKDQNIILAGSVLNNVYISMDGGNSWTKQKLTSTSGVYGDPVVKIDSRGDMLYAHLSNPTGKAYSSVEFLDRIVVQKSIDNGLTWSDGSYPAGDFTKDQDKHWLAFDPKTEHVLMSWTEFDKYGSKDDKDKSRILFSKSTDRGESWTIPVAVSEMEGDCLDDDKTTEGAVPAVGIDGSYYIVWSYNDKIWLDKSTDGGKTWLSKDQIIASQPGGWTYDVPGISRCNGMPMLKIDNSKGSGRGNMYVLWSDQRNGSDDTDIWFISSTNNGKTWSNAMKVNDDKGKKHQFLSWMDVDDATGYIYTVFYDRRAYEDNSTDVYLAYSKDQGKTFINQKISEAPFTPNSHVFFGDYNDISAVNGKIRPIWTKLEGGTLSVLTAIIEFK